MVKKKYQSKRLSLHKKHKIQRKVREHKRQERKKERVGGPGGGGGRKRKDPGIPNNWPFKEELLQQVEQARLAELDAQRQAREKAKEDKKERKRLATLARKNAVPALTPLSVEMQARKDLKESVQKAELVLVVLDARDPQGSRSLSLEDGLIGKGGKKVVLVLNKVDLVTPDTAEKVCLHCATVCVCLLVVRGRKNAVLTLLLLALVCRAIPVGDVPASIPPNDPRARAEQGGRRREEEVACRQGPARAL